MHNFKDGLIKCESLDCNKSYQRKLDEEFKKKLIHINFLTMIKIGLFYCKEKVLSLRIYRWLGKFNETSLPEKEHFHSHLSMEDFEIK